VKVSHRLCSGDPAGTVLAELKTGAFDLIVLGTHGRTGLMHMLLGSVAEKLVRLSPVPVLAVPPVGRRP
jgi:nucleotide-binding universal stress UspA family protein